MNKKLQFVIGASCLVITGLFVYYFTSYLPAKDTLALRKECIDIGEKKVKQNESDSKDLKNGEITSADYVFDAESKRCLYKTMFSASAITEKDIYDLFTNKKLVGYVESGERITEGNIGAYRQLEIDYFDSK
jgi:hypothetical protein